MKRYIPQHRIAAALTHAGSGRTRPTYNKPLPNDATSKYASMSPDAAIQDAASLSEKWFYDKETNVLEGVRFWTSGLRKHSNIEIDMTKHTVTLWEQFSEPTYEGDTGSYSYFKNVYDYNTDAEVFALLPQAAIDAVSRFTKAYEERQAYQNSMIPDDSEGSNMGDISSWYESDEGVDATTKFAQTLQALVYKKYPNCDYYEEPSIQGTAGSDEISIEVNGQMYHFSFDYETMLQDIYSSGAEKAARKYMMKINQSIRSGSALSE